MQNWDKLGHSWNNIGVSSCIISTKPEETAVINAKWFILQPIKHSESVHANPVSIDFHSYIL